MEPNPTNSGDVEPTPSLAALWQEAAEVVQDAVHEAEAAIEFIGTTLASLRPLLARVRALEAQLQETPGPLGAPPQPKGSAPSKTGASTPSGAEQPETEEAPSAVTAQPVAREAVARYTLTLETGETRSDFPRLYRRLDRSLGGAEMALISYLGGVAVITVEGPDLTPEALEHGISKSLGDHVTMEWEDEQHLRLHMP